MHAMKTIDEANPSSEPKEWTDESMKESEPKWTFEVWHAGGGEFSIYVQDWEFAKVLREEFGKCAVYSRAGCSFAWQFKIPRARLPRVKVLVKSQSLLKPRISQNKRHKNQ
jgi:hypothetical protein